MDKLCLIFNIASLYRKAIYGLIDQEYDCDWYFGINKTDIKEFDLEVLKNTYSYKSLGNPSLIYWQGALIPCLFKKKYNTFLIITEDRSISYWLFMFFKSIFFRKKKVYGWSHGLYGREGTIRKLIERWRIKNMTGQFVYNERAKKLFIELGIPADKIHVIANSLDYDTQLKLRKNLKPTNIYTTQFENSNPVIVFIGRLTKVKKLDILLRAVKQLKDLSKLFNIVFIGDGDDRAYLEDLVRQMELQKQVWFYGACYDETKNAELVYNADLCVSPGNVGLTAIHSMMFGTPVITNDDFVHQMPEFEAINKGNTGDFFSKDSAENLAVKIDEWFINHTDREMVRKDCYREIDSKWNPYYQISLIKQVIK